MEEETILQAAKEYAASQHSPWDRGSLRRGYIAGAQQEKARIIEKACNYLNTHTMSESQGEFVNQFKEAMEQ